MRMCVTDSYDSMPAVQIQVLIALIVTDTSTFTFDYVDAKQWIYLKQFHLTTTLKGRGFEF